MEDWEYHLWPKELWHLAALEYLDVIASEGSIGACAARFGRSRATVTATIGKLETTLGYQVLDRERGRSGAEPTPAGRQLLIWFRGLARHAQGVAAAARSLKHGVDGRFQVVASTTTCELLVPRWLRLLQDQQGSDAAAVSLTSTRSSMVVERVKHGGCNVGFIANAATPEALEAQGLESKVVGWDELLVVVPPKHRWVRFHNSKITIDELVKEPHLAREVGSGAREVFLEQLKDKAGADVASKLRIKSVTTNNSVALRTSVLAFEQPAAVSSLAVSEELVAGRLRAIEVEDLGPIKRKRQAIWQKGTEDELRERLVEIARMNSFYGRTPPPGPDEQR